MKLYIPTFKRVDNQLTFIILPDDIKENVIMVVQDQEKDQYKYDCEYLVVDNNIGIAKTRELIYRHAGNQRFGMLDDDVKLWRRNTKYYPDEEPNMESSKRVMNSEDWKYWLSLVNSFLDEDNIMHVGNREEGLPPLGKRYYHNRLPMAVHWIDGSKLSGFIDDVDWCIAQIGEDLVFTLECLMHGYKSVIADEFVMGRWATAFDKGGCSEFRTSEFNDKEMMKIAKKYDFVYPKNDYEVLKNIGKIKRFGVDFNGAYEYGISNQLIFT